MSKLCTSSDTKLYSTAVLAFDTESPAKTHNKQHALYTHVYVHQQAVRTEAKHITFVTTLQYT
jgi:hypothetical protein